MKYSKFTDIKKELKIGLGAVGKMYIICASLRNTLIMPFPVWTE